MSISCRAGRCKAWTTRVVYVVHIIILSIVPHRPYPHIVRSLMMEEEGICLALKHINQLLYVIALVLKSLCLFHSELGSLTPELIADCKSRFGII